MAQKTEPGMLLLDPGEERNGVPARPTVHMVISKKTLLCHVGDLSMKSVLRKAEVPEGWKVIQNRTLARDLLKRFGSGIGMNTRWVGANLRDLEVVDFRADGRVICQYAGPYEGDEVTLTTQELTTDYEEVPQQ